MLTQFFCHDTRVVRAGAWGGLLVFLLHKLFKASLASRINTWYGTFYDTLQESVPSNLTEVDEAHLEELRGRVWDELLAFAWIVAPALIVHPAAGFFNRCWTFFWRRSLVCDYLRRWDIHSPPIEGASQRLHEDTGRMAAGVHGCLSVILDSICTLAVFCPILWSLDPQLMWVAMSTALGGLTVSAAIGGKLVGLEVANQRVEASLRTKLVLLETHPTTLDTEVCPLAAFRDTIADLTRNYMSLFVNFTYLSTWLAIFDQFCVILPFLLTAPRLFSADPARVLTLGSMMQATNAFSHCFNSLNVISESWISINEFRSTYRRLREFERDLYGGSGAPPPPAGAKRLHEAVVTVELGDDAPAPVVDC